MARIKNGYAPELVSARGCLQELSRRLRENPDMRDWERRRINLAIREHTETVAYYQLTDALLKQMREISPKMFDFMDELKDKRGRETDIYVRFIPKERSMVLFSGASYFQESASDEDASQSRFGALTVAIDIWICDSSLQLLAHEFGHTCYIVPNLSTYLKFYHNVYSGTNVISHAGHSPSDASGKLAYDFGSQFARDRRSFRSDSGPIPHVSVIARNIRKHVEELIAWNFAEALASASTFD